MQPIFVPLLAAISLLATYPASAQGLPLNLKVGVSGETKQPKRNALHAIELSCVHLGPEQLQPAVLGGNIFVEAKYTTALSLFIGTQPPSNKPDGTSKLNGAVAYAPIALIDSGGETKIDNTNACKQTFLVTNASSLFLVPTVSLTKTYSAGFLATFVDKAIALATAIAPAILTGGIAAPTAASLSAVQNSIKPLNDLIATFNKSQNYTGTRPLKVGKTIVTTDYTRITISVREISSILVDPVANQDLIDELKKSIDNAPTKLTTTDIRTNCNLLVSAIAKAGFRDQRDQAFALGYLAVNTFGSKDNVITCLGSKLAGPAAALGDLLWSGYPFRVTPEDASMIQPSFSDLKSRLNDLFFALGGYARRDNAQPAPKEVMDILSTQFAPQVKIVDRTGKLNPVDSSYSVPSVIDFLVSKGFRRFGCYAQATEATGSDIAKASVIFLAFKADPSASQAKLNDGVAIHPIYQNDRLAILRVSDNSSGWIDAVLADRTKAYYCKNLEILK